MPHPEEFKAWSQNLVYEQVMTTGTAKAKCNPGGNAYAATARPGDYSPREANESGTDWVPDVPSTSR